MPLNIFTDEDAEYHFEQLSVDKKDLTTVNVMLMFISDICKCELHSVNKEQQ